MKIGDKVNWYQGKRKRAGSIHGVQKAENENGNERVIGYVIDTGKVDYEQERVDDDGNQLDPLVQPKMVTVSPDDVKLAE